MRGRPVLMVAERDLELRKVNAGSRCGEHVG
jgi:hypothetical protein